MWRMIIPVVVLIIAFVVVQSQIAGLMTSPAPGAAANNQPKTWMLLPLPKNPKIDPQDQARRVAEKKQHEVATLLRPFARPYTFEAKREGYKVVFPGQPSPPMYREITRAGTTWLYEEQRLGTIKFMVMWDESKKSRTLTTDRECLDRWKNQYLKWTEDLHGKDKRWFQTQRYFTFQGKYAAAEVIDHYHFSTNDDYYGQQTSRRWFIQVNEDMYRIEIDGNAEVVASHLADDFFNSFELVPKVVKK